MTIEVEDRLDWVDVDNVLTDDDCHHLIQKAYEIGFKVSGLGNDAEGGVYTNKEIRNSLSARVPIEKNLWIQEKLIRALSKANSHFKFDLGGIMDLQVLKYNVGSYIKPHLDVYSHCSQTQRKVTFVIQLSNDDEYDGGELRLHIDHEPIVMSKKKGNLIAFPAYTLHDVTTILSGHRYSCIGWCFGPDFK